MRVVMVVCDIHFALQSGPTTTHNHKNSPIDYESEFFAARNICLSLSNLAIAACERESRVTHGGSLNSYCLSEVKAPNLAD